MNEVRDEDNEVRDESGSSSDLRVELRANSSSFAVLGSEESGFRESPRPVLEHCDTAPVRSNSNSLVCTSHKSILSRSKTYKEEAAKFDLKLDMLSESEKKKIIDNLVKIQNDSTVAVDVDHNAPVASELLELGEVVPTPSSIWESVHELTKSARRLNIAILVVGTRGDVQPFLGVAKRLQEFGHQVRLASHVNFRNFVLSNGVDFYPLGGDPRILTEYMVRNKGFLLAGPTDINIQRKQLKEIIESLLPACTEPDVETGEPFKAQGMPMLLKLLVYRCIFSSRCLGRRPTHEFPHPMARVPQRAAYRVSYILVDLIVWLGIRGFINDFRKRKLKLQPIAYFSTYHGSISHLPTGYMWSPHLVPKPSDWGPLVDVVGFCFLNLGTKYQPQDELSQWIEQGPKPIYIGFGSMPLEDGKKMMNIILEVLKETGQRGIIDRGWGDLGISSEVPSDVFLLEDCPHDWLFPKCSSVVHHGGAGTTATGLRAGCPTTIIPFFGDQFFWGDRIHSKGVGPAPIPISELNVERLSNAIRFMLEPEVKLRTMELAKLIQNEDGVAAAVDAFHRHLPPEIPIPLCASDDKAPHPFQWLLQAIERWCCLPCT